MPRRRPSRGRGRGKGSALVASQVRCRLLCPGRAPTPARAAGCGLRAPVDSSTAPAAATAAAAAAAAAPAAPPTLARRGGGELGRLGARDAATRAPRRRRRVARAPGAPRRRRAGNRVCAGTFSWDSPAARSARWACNFESSAVLAFEQFFHLPLTRAYMTTVPAGDSLLFPSACLRFPRAALGGKTPGSPPSSCLSRPLPPPLPLFSSGVSDPGSLNLSVSRAGPGCWGLNGAGAQTRRSPRDFPRRCLPTHTPARGSVPTDPTPLFLFAGKLWVTAPAGAFAICPPGPGEEEPAAPRPLPLHHHFGYSAGTCFGVPTDFQEGLVPFSDLCSGGHLCLPC